ncbi:MAG: peroxiredoxin family protein [Actinomycetota bacterium]|nr:peroxiredoxin family protein [Actinomycetota bacterium]
MSTTRSREQHSTRGAAGKGATDDRQQRLRRLLTQIAIIGVVVLVALYLLARDSGEEAAGAAGGPPFSVGEPGVGAEAPPFRLEATNGEIFDLAEQRGENVLLYFQEGVGCQPCWDQMRDIDESWAEFQALGVDRFVTITGDPLDRLRQKVDDEGLETLVLSDPGLSLGETYEANQYGMMGTSTYGHSFVLVDPDGRITWRADYGGAPKFTMYVRPTALLDDLRAGIGAEQ